jgi:hypothetical protein
MRLHGLVENIAWLCAMAHVTDGSHSIRLEEGRTYMTGFGSRRTIMGAVKGQPDWVYSLDGFWYRRSDGRHITTSLTAGVIPLPCPNATFHDLVTDITEWTEEECGWNRTSRQ